MESLGKFITKYWILIIAILSIPACLALLVPGFYGASDDIHIAWLDQMDKALKMGQIPPRFVPDLSFGFGYPLFNFVFPLPFYIAEIFHLLGLSLVDSIKALFFITVPLSGIFMYLLLRCFTNSLLSLTGAILYIYTPYRAVDLYVRGAIGEVLSFVFLPLIILSAIKLKKSGNFKWVGVGALSLASLVLSHNITAYMFFPFVATFLIIQVFLTHSKKAFLAESSLMVFLSFLISLYFWLPALLESRLMQYDTVFNFADHFPTLRQLFTPYWGYGASVPGPDDGMSFYLGGANILLLFLGLIFTLIKWKQFMKEEKTVLIWVILAIFLAIFLMNHRSLFFWNTIPNLAYFQFPWRFLILATFLMPLLAISLKYLKLKDYLAVGMLLVALAGSWSYFRPSDFLGRKDDYYLKRYIPVPVASGEYYSTSEEYLRLPKATKARPEKNYPTFSPPQEVKLVEKINDLHFIATLDSQQATWVNFNKYFFPGWQAKLDGNQIELSSGSPFGQIIASVPSGFHRLEIYFAETDFRKILNFASLLGFLVSLLLGFRGKKAIYGFKK